MKTIDIVYVKEINVNPSFVKCCIGRCVKEKRNIPADT